MSDEQRTGTGDPERTLQLLWGRQEQTTRGPRPALTVARIVDAAVELADADGLAAVSMRKVAERLGVGTMSLYRYVPGKGELLDLMFDRVVGGELERARPPEGDWRAQLEQAGREALETHLRHPWLLEIVSGNRPPLGPNVMDSYERLLAIMGRSGLPQGELHVAVDVFGTYVAGAARTVVQERQMEAKTGVSDEEWWESRRDFWESYFDAERFPTLTSLYVSGALDASLDSFEYGLQRVLDGIEARIAAVRAQPPAPA